MTCWPRNSYVTLLSPTPLCASHHTMKFLTSTQIYTSGCVVYSPMAPSASWSAKTVLLPYSYLSRSLVYGFNQLPFTFPGYASPFNFTNLTASQSVISLMTLGASQCILNFPRNLSNLLSYNNTKSFTLKVCSLMC